MKKQLPESISVRLSEEQAAFVRDKAATGFMSNSAFLRMLVFQRMEQEDNKEEV